ncbi:cytidylate kinase-like family protein [Actinomadura barringtoniae]|uniref:Cytidylate kinase-like family protein n=1 Tax=Actinomadura barringtoniae TaxID=1427535 RepID=A0A939T1R5_9ACTN|nr:cytidylate kinase-like family protein [Actinomadura barringtoniae]MBO2448116.1 cytidylate kinase-like family protein [Actinomadura barringtoniae]
MSARVVTISATFGAGGSTVGPAVAERLGLPFIDRAVPATVAAEIGCTLEEALAHDGRTESGIGRILAGAARLPNVSLAGMDIYLPDRTILPEEEFVTRTEQVITRAVDADGGVLLGRAGAVLLADHPHALHVRLDGDRERRLERARTDLQGAESEAGAGPGEPPNAGATRETVTSQGDLKRMLDDNDRARAAYVKHFYGADPADPRLYHLVIDSTRLPGAAVVELVVAAARAV